MKKPKELTDKRFYSRMAWIFLSNILMTSGGIWIYTEIKDLPSERFYRDAMVYTLFIVALFASIYQDLETFSKEINEMIRGKIS